MASASKRAPAAKVARRLWHSVAGSVTCALLAVACGSDSGNCPVCPTPTPVVAAGTVTVSPAGVGIAWTTAFTFVAQGFGSSDGGPLTYLWDFHDGELVSGGATVLHEFASAGSFDVRVTVKNSAGVTAAADARRVQVTSLSGRWGIRDANGTLVLGSTALTQDGRRVWGDDLFGECRFSVTGTVSPQRELTVEYRRQAGLCQRDQLPDAMTFTGAANDGVTRFEGRLDSGAAASFVRCSSPYTCS